MTKFIGFVTRKTDYDFVGKRKAAFVFSFLLVIASIGSLFWQGLDYGIDFKGGILIEIQSEKPLDIGEMRNTINNLNIGDISLQAIGSDNQNFLIHTLGRGDDEKTQMQMVEKIKTALGEGITFQKVEVVGPKVGSELVYKSIIASILALLAIFIYIWVRFEWQFAVGCTLSLAFVMVTTLGIFSIFQIDFTLNVVAAILAVAGYATNDTIVSYDRVRENLRKYRKMELNALVNRSTNDTLSRTILTGTTTFLAIIVLLVLGGDALRGFSIAMLWGLLIGTFSSIYVAMPILSLFDVKKTIDAADSPTSATPVA
ncbi:MAG: protein translocase subunit SecF [Alphaproteobacteria bacterium]|nr:protein translocase subunit SecF [Alphaproteobacteria bacterium]